MVTRSDALKGVLRAGVCMAALAAVAGCSTSLDNYLESPIYTASTNNQREILLASSGTTSYAPLTSNRPTASPPYSGQQYNQTGYRETPAIVVDRQELPPPVNVTSSQPAQDAIVIKAARGDSLGSLSQQYNVSVDELRAANNIGPGGLILPGQDIVIPQSGPQTLAATSNTQQVPVQQVSSVAPTSPKAVSRQEKYVRPEMHTVSSGETMGGIANRYGLTTRQIASANEISDPNRIRIGQRLKIPAKDYTPSNSIKVAALETSQKSRSTVDVPQAVPAQIATPKRRDTDKLQVLQPIKRTATTNSQPVQAIETSTVQPAKTQPVTRTELRQSEVVADLPDQKIKSTGSKPEQNSVATAAVEPDGLNFRWPVKGRVVSTFGEQLGEIRNDGINVLVPEGASVKAAEAGTVLYSGDRLKGYGKLVLVRHVEGYVTAYAHNSELLVAPGDLVKRGQIIARAGMSGGVDASQVHFEIRKGAQPVNPLDYLSASL